MPYVIKCVRGEHEGKFFDPWNQGCKFQPHLPERVGRGRYGTLPVVNGTLHRLLKLCMYKGLVLEPAEVPADPVKPTPQAVPVGMIATERKFKFEVLDCN